MVIFPHFEFKLSCFGSVLAGGLAEAFSELADEIAVVVKAGGVGNLGDRTGGAGEQGASFT